MKNQDPRNDIESAIRAAAPTGFTPGFSDRVSRRLAGEGAEGVEPAFAELLERQFVRIVPFAVAASLLLGAYNWWGGRTAGGSAFEAALNLPRVSIAAAYSPSTLYGAQWQESR